MSKLSKLLDEEDYSNKDYKDRKPPANYAHQVSNESVQLSRLSTKNKDEDYVNDEDVKDYENNYELYY
jgi:hypothetical protein